MRRGSEFGRQIAVDFQSNADFHECWSCPVHSRLPRFRVCQQASTTLADLFTLLFAANPFSAARASLWRWSSDEFEDGLAPGGRCRFRGGGAGSFFSVPLVLA